MYRIRLNLSLVDEEDNENNQLAANSHSATLTLTSALSGLTCFLLYNAHRDSTKLSSPHPSNSLKNDDTPRLQRPEPRAPCSQRTWVDAMDRDFCRPATTILVIIGTVVIHGLTL